MAGSQTHIGKYTRGVRTGRVEKVESHSRTAPKAAQAAIFVQVDPLTNEFKAIPRQGQTVNVSLTMKNALLEALDFVRSGGAPRLSVTSLITYWEPIFSSDELHEIVIPQRTFARRKASGEPLTVDETERALRLARIASEAERVFADTQKAARWLRKPNRALNAHSPMALLVTETGARAVEELLGQIDHGFFA